MQNIPDKDLDQLFKDSNTDHNISFEESSWLKLEAKLNSDRKRKNTKNLVALLIVLLAIGTQFFGSIFNLYNYNDKIAENIVDAKTTSITEKTKAETNTSFIGKASVNAVDREGLTESKNSLLEQASELKQERSPSEIRISKGKPVYRKENEIIEKEQASAILKEKIFYNSTESKNAISVSQGRYEGNGVREVKEEDERIVLNHEGYAISVSDSIGFPAAINIGSKNVNDVLPNQNEKNIITLPESSADINVMFSDTSEATEPGEGDVPLKAETIFISSSKIKKDNMAKFRKFSAGVFVSPDFSSTDFFKFSTPGTDIGVFGEYHLTRRWTLFTGIIRTSKIYSSENGYHASNGYWANKDKADRIHGSCKVLDIPLNIKYHFIQNSRNLVFISTGLSSYLMSDERYTFVYNSTNTERSWNSNPKRNYYFSVVNFSIGYERFLSKTFSIQAEPFIKVPVKNIGAGKATLMTAGVFFYLKYNIGIN